MNKTELNKKIIKTLKKMGYVPKLDEDQDVGFYYQLKWVFVLVNTDDEGEVVSICVSMARIYELDNETKGARTGVLIVSNDLSQEKRLTKVTVDLEHGCVNAHSQFLYSSEKALEQYFERLLDSDELGDVTSTFARRMKNLSE